GVARGIAVAEDCGTVVAEVAEVSVVRGEVKVHRVVAAVDCGPYVNPDTIEAQVEGAIVYGLTVALKGEITVAGGRVEQANFDAYPMMRIDDMPKVEIVLIESDAPMGGIGEPGLPPAAPAVCNAIFALTGTRVRQLPIRLA
ncbi:MAG TPA: xanthine dehydrogenase family protein molybdopterin-binding subunit, partial [Bacteroidetes bacterium]|nr:xanthine dehydrogenase family protein molybdopterin-binding subunit [Bacteroidota bacterium]